MHSPLGIEWRAHVTSTRAQASHLTIGLSSWKETVSAWETVLKHPTSVGWISCEAVSTSFAQDLFFLDKICYIHLLTPTLKASVLSFLSPSFYLSGLLSSRYRCTFNLLHNEREATWREAKITHAWGPVGRVPLFRVMSQQRKWRNSRHQFTLPVPFHLVDFTTTLLSSAKRPLLPRPHCGASQSGIPASFSLLKASTIVWVCVMRP